MHARIGALAILMLLGSQSLHAVSIDTVVASFYPQTLIDRAVRNGVVPLRYQAYEQTTFGEAGQAYVVAAYTNGFDGAVRVLKNTSNGWVLAAEPGFDGFDGAFPEVELRDLNGDSIPEMTVTFVATNGRGDENWIFRWKNHALALVSPSTAEGSTRSTEFTDVEFFDVDGDGIPEVIDRKSAGSSDAPQPADRLYKWSDGGYIAAGSVTYRHIFGRAKGQPTTERDAFDVDGVAPKYTLIVVNGGLRGADHRTSSAEVTLNGTVVVPPALFNQQQGAISVPVTLQTENRIAARVAGEAGSQIAVIIRSTP